MNYKGFIVYCNRRQITIIIRAVEKILKLCEGRLIKEANYDFEELEKNYFLLEIFEISFDEMQAKKIKKRLNKLSEVILQDSDFISI